MLYPKLLLFALALPLAAAESDLAATATNQLGLDLLRQLATDRPGENLIFSPYAIQEALALVYAGTDGTTRSEMARVLHFPTHSEPMPPSFAALRASIDHTAGSYEKRTASRLFAQQGNAFGDSFLTFIRENAQASLQSVDFTGDPAGARDAINAWMGNQTKNKITNILPPDGVTSKSRLVLASTFAVHATWDEVFDPAGTRPRSFHFSRSSEAQTAFITQTTSAGYSKREGFSAIILPFGQSDLQLLILLPDEVEGVVELSRKLTPPILRDSAKLPNERIALFVPKFQLEGTALTFGKILQKLGMKSVFDLPPGSVNFGNMVSEKSNSTLALSEVFHRASIRTNESGSSAFSPLFVHTDSDRGYGTYNTLQNTGTTPQVHVDHPFLFAVLHRATGTCLLLGRITDPR